ncbi:MAG: zinc-ribbon domain-containing protein [Planctomycetota bacterium]
MSDRPSFSCPSCGATYRLQDKLRGKRVKCAKCAEVIAVPEAAEPLEDLEEIPEEPRIPKRRPGERPGSRSSRARRGSRSSSRGRDSVEQKSKMPLLLGAGGGVIVLAIVLFLVLGNGGGPVEAGGGSQASSGDGSSGNASQETAKQESAGQGEQRPNEVAGSSEPEEKKPRDEFDALLAKAEEASGSDKASVLWKAAVLRLHNDLAGAETYESLARRVIEIEEDHAAARKALGHRKYEGPLPEYQGKWTTPENRAAIKEEERAFARAEAERKDKERWTKDSFSKKCARVRDYFKQDVKSVPEMSLRFFFDTPEIPRPYFLMVEDAEIPDPAETARMLGPGLNELRKAFRKSYTGITLAAWDDEENVVPVLIFKSTKSYEKYRDNHKNLNFPSTESVGAFYVSSPFTRHMKGVLYVWQNWNEHSFMHNVFHEATHQLMDNAHGPMRTGTTPWLQEGIAEYFGTYAGNRYTGFEFGKFLPDRYGSVQTACIAMNQALRAGRKEGSFMTLKQLLEFDRDTFQYYRSLGEKKTKERNPGDRAKAGTFVGLAYAKGWAFCFFCYNYMDGMYREAFKRLLADELRNEYSVDKIAGYLGIESEEDWEELNRQFSRFCLRTLRKYKAESLEAFDPTKAEPLEKR